MPSRISPRPLESYPASVVRDIYGRQHRSRSFKWNGVRVYVPHHLETVEASDSSLTDAAIQDRGSELARRDTILAALIASGRFTPAEIRTLTALARGQSLNEIARADGCSRQAVIARLTGNSAGHGGLLRKLASVDQIRIIPVDLVA